jgi:pimeloyl-ACP methyl ester carboxylesterase
LLYDQEWFEEIWQKKDPICNKKSLFIWGMKDPVLKPHLLDKFVSGFSQHKIHRLDTCGHVPQEEEPELTARFISDFLHDKT